MSYDGYVLLRVAPEPVIPAGVDPWDYDDRSEVELAEVGNMTSNVSRMWTRALTAVAATAPDVKVPDDGLLSLGDTSGWSCKVVAPLYRAAAEWMTEHAAELRELNPANGWGDYEGALEYMGRAASLAERYATVRSDHGAAYLYWSR